MKKVAKNILAEGEATGHYHQAKGKGAKVYDRDDGSRLLEAPNGAKVVHQEHAEIKLPPGEYDRLIVREYDPFQEAAREVVD